MRIRQVEKKVWNFKGKTTQVTFEDSETGRVYSRIISGLGWPWGEKPGAAICLAESWDRDHSLQYSPRHLYLLEEFYSQDIEELYRSFLRYRDELCAAKIFANPNSSLKSLWSKLGDEGDRIYITAPPGLESADLNFTVQLLRKRTSLQKRCILGRVPRFPDSYRYSEKKRWGGKAPWSAFQRWLLSRMFWP